MIYDYLFEQTGNRVIRAGMIGAGEFGLTLLVGAQTVPRLTFSVVCDRDQDTVRRTCTQAGIAPDQLVIAETHDQVIAALEAERIAVIADASLMMDSPLDVIVEGTGHPEAGARHAEQAIRHGKHVAMVNKETDSVIGPILARMAAQAGVVYTHVDGDQHGLLTQLVAWARALGLDVISAGKARPYDFVLDESARSVTNSLDTVQLESAAWDVMAALPPGENASERIRGRGAALDALPQIGEADLCEAVMMANATGLMPDVPPLHAPIVRTTEIPRVLCPEDDGGLLARAGAIDVITCLRRPDEPGMGGGVFVVFGCPNLAAWEILRAKGIPSHREDRYGLLIRPYHLLGIETPLSILSAALLGLPTGARATTPRIDLVARTRHDLAAGDVIEAVHHYSARSAYVPELHPAAPAQGSAPAPFYMATGQRVTRDVPAGTLLTVDMIAPPADSRLWALRAEQDRVFLRN